MIFILLSTTACLAGIAIITRLHTRHHLDVVVRPEPPPVEAPLISVIVPARNEDRNLRRCAESLLAQNYPNFELIVLDDRSTDATALILSELAERHPRLRPLTGDKLPDGWAGKPHALAQAAAAARGDWLCFVDADTFVSPTALAAVYAAAREQSADLFTILTFQELDSFWEKVVLPLVMTALSVGFPPRRVNRPDRRDAIANGQFILIKRAVYAAVGGYAAIKDSLVEDKDLANLVKHSGYRLIVADGRQVARTRMYTSLAELWEGWTKNIFLGLKGSPGLLLLGAFGAFLSLFAAFALPLWLAAGLVWWGGGGGVGALAVAGEAALLWGYLVVWRLLVCRGMRIPPGYALTVPLGAGVFAGMMLASAWKVLSGQGVTWKGRKYSSRS
jgi:chlorobactene glucosyltransferase